MPEGRVQRECTGVQWQGQRQWTQTETQISSEQETIFTVRVTERGHRLPRQVVCGFSILGDIQNPTGHDPGQPLLGDPAWAGPDDLWRFFPTSAILWFKVHWMPVSTLLVREGKNKYLSLNLNHYQIKSVTNISKYYLCLALLFQRAFAYQQPKFCFVARRK